jgi:DNA-binding SARP family transcriptional activator/tetratricopeptide (TPR) repeat protein
MKRDNAFRLITLGRIALVTPDGREEDTLGKRRRKLALLAMVALTNRPLPRDLLIEIFWGDQDEARARHSLSDTLSHLRRVLGREAMSTRSADVSLSEEAALLIDSREFESAVAAQEFARAVDMYGGPFLDGLYVEGSQRWDQWVSRERVKLEELFLKACDKQCMALARTRKWQECGELAARWLEISPASTDAALYRLNALKSPGTREADARALEEFGRLEQRLRRELEVSPAPPVVALAKSIAARLAEAGERTAEMQAVKADVAAVTPGSVLAIREERRSVMTAGTVEVQADEVSVRPTGEAAGASTERPAPTRGSDSGAAPTMSSAPGAGSIIPPGHESFPATTEEWRALRAIPVPATTGEWRVLRDRLSAPQPVVARRRPWWPVALGASLLVVAMVLAGWQLRTRTTRQAAAGSLGRPSVAIVGISTAGDTAHRWLSDGLAQMMAATLSRTSAVEVVTPERVRQILARAELDTSPVISRERLFDIGKRLGATWIVSGAVSGGDSHLVFDVNVHDIASGDRVAFDVVDARTPMALAEAAAARVLNAAGARSPGPRLADIETANVEAYERYTRAHLSNSQGRADDARRDLDAAIALDSAFVSAIRMRLAMATNAEELQRYSELFNRHAHRASDFDRYWKEVNDAMLAGEHARSEALGRNFVARFPRDPRTYELLAFVYSHHGRFDEVLRTLEAELALDSLALEVGSGACAPCGAYRGIAEAHMLQANNAAAIRAARRWVQLQTDAPAAWFLLSNTLNADQQFPAALDALARAMELSGGNNPYYMLARIRIRIAMRDYATAEREIESLLSHPDVGARSFAWDTRIALERERGTLRKSLETHARAIRDNPGMTWLELVRGNTLARLGRYDEAARIYESATHFEPLEPALAPAHSARAFAWHHALLADAISRDASPERLDAIADTILSIAPRSYYGRDWRLGDHVRGLAQMRREQYEQAAASFRRAIWIPVGWTRTNAELAKAEMALGRPTGAIQALRPAYSSPIDAMGRYLTRSELDYLMALAFRQASEPDSALVYAERVRIAWRDADPEVKQLLSALER